MPKAIAEGREKVSILSEVPEGASESGFTISAEILNAGQDASCNLARNGHRMSATASDMHADPAICDEGNTQGLGPSNYEWSWNVFRYYDAETGLPDASEDWVFEMLEEKGATIVAAQRRNGARYDKPWEAGESGFLWVGRNDNPQVPSDMSGYQKMTVPFAEIKRFPFTVAA